MKHRPLIKQAYPLCGAALMLSLTACNAETENASGKKSAAYTTASSVFINEIHYDNSGTDSGEAIEIAGPAGTDLSDYSVVLYNGSNGSVYDTIALAGTLDDEAASGFGTTQLTFPANGIQNGGPDGIALVQGTTVVSFLSYEGTFTAVGGPADGLVSTDIGVSESSSTEAGFSLQRVGEGTLGTDFTWSGPSVSSFDAINDGQSFGGGAGGTGGGSGSGGTGSGGASTGGSGGGSFVDVFLSEIHYDNTGTDEGEGFELQGPAGTDLSAWTVVLYNGNGGGVYNTIQLAGTVPDEADGQGAVAFSLPANGLQNGAPDGLALLDPSGAVVEFLSYEGTMTAVDGPAAGTLSVDLGVSESSATAVGDSLQLIDGIWTGPSTSSFGSLNGGSTGGGGSIDIGACSDAFTAISALQGSGFATPLEGQQVVVEGVVVGDFQGGDEQLGGFFIQSETPDGDSATSEGVFVYDLEAPLSIDVAIGQKVRVAGTAEEFFELTQIGAAEVIDCGLGAAIEPTPLAFPVEENSDWESLEGMLVTASDLYVTEIYDLARYGEVSLSAGGRLFNPTNGNGMTSEQNAAHRILLDDARDAQNLDPVAYLGEDGTLRLGDRLPQLTAVLSYGFSAYRLQPQDLAGVEFVRENPRQDSPDEVGGDIKVASLNVLNYFTTLGERGADTLEELERQRAKLVSAVIALDADVVGLMEIENNDANGDPVALDDFVASINAELGAEVYARAPDPNSTGTDAIRTAIIYRPAVVTALPISLSDEDPVHSRLPIAQAFSYEGDTFSVVVNHFKSKGSCPSDASDPNADMGMGCWNVLRTQQAEALLAFIDELKAETGDEDVIVLGDLNSYLAEDPIAVLEAAGLTNLVTSLPVEGQYSYVFFGESGVLDYAMTTPSLDVSGVTIWHINADEPRLLDYNTEFNPPLAYVPDAFRASDHDPIVIGISFTRDPLSLAGALKDKALEIANEAGLSGGRRRQWEVLLSAAEDAIEGAAEASAWGARIKRAVAKAALRLFSGRVAAFERRGWISQEQASCLLDDADALKELL